LILVVPTGRRDALRYLAVLLTTLVFVQRVFAQAQPRDAAFTHNEAGKRLLAARHWKEAASEFRASLALNPQQAQIEINLGIALWGVPDRQGAEDAFRRAITLNPQSADAHFAVAIARRDLGDTQHTLDELNTALKLRPNYEQAEIALGLVLQQSGRLEEAIAQYKRILIRHPQSADAHNWLGVVYLQQSKLPEASAEFRHAIRLNPQYVRAYNNLGSTLAQAGEVQAAIATFEAGLKHAADDVELRLNLAMALKSAGKQAQAIQLFEALVKEHPENADLKYQLGQALRQKGDLAGAVEAFDGALSSNPEMREAYYALAAALKAQSASHRRTPPVHDSAAQAQARSLCDQARAELAKGEVQRATTTLQKAIETDSKSANAENLLGFALGRAGDLRSAVEHLKTAVALDPSMAEAHYNLGAALWYAGDRGSAIPEFERSVQLDPAATNATSFLGIAYREQNELARSRRMCQHAIALSPDTAHLYFDLAIAYLREGQLEPAIGQLESGLNVRSKQTPIPDIDLTIAELRKAISAKGPSAEAQNTLGRLLGLAGADERQVIAAFQEAIRQQLNYAEAHNNLGLVYTQAGDDEKAIASFREAARIRPDFADAHQNLGTVLITSDPVAAVKELERAVALEPGSLKAQYNLALAYDASPSGGLAKEIDLLKKVLAAEPKYPHAEFALGKALLKSGKIDEAISHLEIAVRNEPEHGQAYYQLGLGLARAGRKAESADALQKSRQLTIAADRQENGNLDLRKGRAALEAGKIDEASALFERLVTMWPGLPQGHYYLGLVRKRQGDTARAEESFRKALELKPAYVEAKTELYALKPAQLDPERDAIEADISRGNYAEAERRLHSYVEAHPKSSWAWYALGYCHYGDHKFGESIRALAQSLQLDLTNAEAHKVLGRDLMMIGRFDAARIEFQQGMRYEPKSAEMPYNLGKLYSIQDNWALAKKSFEQALALDPQFMEAYDGLGLALESLGDKEGAIATYQKAIDLNEAQQRAFGAPYVNMSALYNAAGDAKKALEFAQRGLKANPKSDRALFQMAKAYRRDGKVEEAIDCLNRAIALNPNVSSYFYLLASAYQSIGKMEDSRKAMESFTKLNNLSNELEQKRINWFKEEGNQVQLTQRPVASANN
jgi:tetratricopeptide (TPR) repeat protein